MVTAVEVVDVAMAAEAVAEAAATAVAEVVTAVEAGVAATAVARAVLVATTTAAKSNPFGFKRGGGFPRPVFLSSPHCKILWGGLYARQMPFPHCYRRGAEIAEDFGA